MFFFFFCLPTVVVCLFAASYACVCTLSAALSLFYSRLFSNLVGFSVRSLPCPTSWNVSAATWAAHSASTVCFPLLCVPRFGESNLPLAETSATIKVSPIGGIILLKGFACTLEAGLGNILGCHMCRPGMRQNDWECQKILPPSSLSYCSCTLSWFTWARLGVCFWVLGNLFAINEYFTKKKKQQWYSECSFELVLFSSVSGR